LLDQAKLVSDSVASVVREGAIAAGLTALMILLFLGSWRSTLIVMISIPLSILTSIIVLHFLGETINTMTLGGLALAVGILVDDSTVTIENTHRLRTEEGYNLAAATLQGSAGIAVPTLVSTLAISCVFTSVADALQPGTRTLLTEVDIPNSDGTLTAGVYGTIELHIPRKTPSLLVPADAIIFNRDGLQVAVIEDGTAHIRKVSVTRDSGTQVEVGDGVKHGDQVIVNPPVSLIEGSKVRARGAYGIHQAS